MTQYTPTWRVKINGVELTDSTLSNLSISSGRDNIYEQAQAGYCNVTLINLTDTPYAINIYEQISIEVTDSTGTFVPIFGGYITDVIREVAQTGHIGFTQYVRIIALGAIHRLQRVTTQGVLTKDEDGDQIYLVLSEVLFAQWQSVAPSVTWATYNAAQTWENAENAGLGEIDRPGDYELHERSAQTTTVYDLAVALATSGLGYIYEDAQGRISYADSTHRSQYLSTNGYVDLDANDAIGIGIKTAVRSGDVRNKVVITYKNGQEESAEDLASQATYGVLSQNILTSIENGADAQLQADFYLELRAYPRANLDAVTFQLVNPNITDAVRDALLGVSMGTAVNLTNLPQSMGNQFQGFVEGWTFNAGVNSLSLTMRMSPVSYSLQAFRWNSVPITEAWNTVSATLTWEEATIVA